jgi:hypothetical protein
MTQETKEQKFKKACPESAKILEEKQKPSPDIDDDLLSRLTNTAWQRGLSWRSEKINAVAEARQRGLSEKDIFIFLKKCGLIDATARAIMKDASYVGESK